MTAHDNAASPTSRTRVGLLVGREEQFPPVLIERINALGDGGVVASFMCLGGTRMDAPSDYRVVVDRLSHEVPYFRTTLKMMVLNGTHVINNPFWFSADDKFFESALALKLGVAVPRTIVLPSREYQADIHWTSLRNLEFPLPWHAIVDYVGLPAILKPFDGGQWKNVFKVESMAQLIWEYERTGALTMMLQEYIDFEDYARCIGIGDQSQVIHYDPSEPHERRYRGEPTHFGGNLVERIKRDIDVLMDALGYQVNTFEFAIKDGVPYAIDFFNPAPDFDLTSIGPDYFEWTVDTLARLVVDIARSPAEPQTAPYWRDLLGKTSSA